MSPSAIRTIYLRQGTWPGIPTPLCGHSDCGEATFTRVTLIGFNNSSTDSFVWSASDNVLVVSCGW